MSFINKLLFIVTVLSFSYSQNCVSNAGLDFQSCGGQKSGSNYRVYLNGENSYIIDGDINYKWTPIDEGISFSTTQSRKENPYFNYPQNLSVDTKFHIQLRVYDDDETCQSFDTVAVTCQANMCPIPSAGDDVTLSNGCDLRVNLDASETLDPDDSSLNYSWISLNGFNSNIEDATAQISEFIFPVINQNEILKFELTVNDGENFKRDTLTINYLDNFSPVSDAGEDFETCEGLFVISGKKSYDIDKNNLTYNWSFLDGSLETSSLNARDLTIESPKDLGVDSNYRLKLVVSDGFCSSSDTVLVSIKENLCPVADAGDDIRIPLYDKRDAVLNASSSYDPDSENISFKWTLPSGAQISDSVLTVEKSFFETINQNSSFFYHLEVQDGQGAISYDSIVVTLSDFSPPSSPDVFAVADHNRVLVSWSSDPESSIDSLTGYSDFEGYKLYRSKDGGNTWGGSEDKLYDFDGNFIGWLPYAQFDLSYDEDVSHCIYTSDNCASEDPRRDKSFYGLDPYLPRFSLGDNSGIQYSFVDSNVVDGIEYTYTVTAYDIGLESFGVEFTEDSISGIFTSDTIWANTNPDRFIGPSHISFFGNEGQFLREEENPSGGYPYSESSKGASSSDNNFITVIPGYTASNIAFPDEKDIEALFSSDSLNIGTGIRSYFIVDRKEINSKKYLKYEIQAEQSPDAVSGMATENPLLYVYESNLNQEPVSTSSFEINDLDYFQFDSLSGLPGALASDNILHIPDYQLITPVGKWSDMMDGIRLKYENLLPLNPLAVPDFVGTFTYLENDGSPIDSSKYFKLLFADQLEIIMEYTNLNSYKRRLNFDYMIELFDAPIGDSIDVSGINGAGTLGLPFRITNLFTGKKVSVNSADWGNENANPIDEENGAGDITWTRNEEIFLSGDTLNIAGNVEPTYNFNLKINFRVPNRYRTQSSWDENKEYEENDTVFFKQMLWTSVGFSKDQEPSAEFLDLNNDGVNDNSWRPWYPWSGGEKIIIYSPKFFVDGDSWFSDMSVLGSISEVADTTLKKIKVVPNPYIVRSRFNESATSRKMRFTNLPQSCKISIFTITGEIVKTINHTSQFDGNAWWDLRSENNQVVAPGLYIYYVESDNGEEHIGKFAVIR